MRTPPKLIDALRDLQKAVASEATRYFATEDDGSFSIDVSIFKTAVG